MTDIFDTSNENVEIEISDNKIVKGDDINISAKDPTMTGVIVGVGWDMNAFDSDTLDLDVSCFLLNKEGKTRVDEDFVFYNNMETLEGAVTHYGDNRTGAGDGDDEQIGVKLNDIPYEVTKVMFVLSIYKGEEKEQTMGKLKNPYIRVLNDSNNEELLRYELTEDIQGSKDTGMLVGALSREGPKWHFQAVGEFVHGGLAQIATDYDIIVHSG